LLIALYIYIEATDIGIDEPNTRRHALCKHSLWHEDEHDTRWRWRWRWR
jgi:hypothetical protein